MDMLQATKGKKNLLFVGTVSANCLPLRNCTAWRACLGPLIRFWPFVCCELRKIPNNQLSSGHGPNDRRSSSARRQRLEGLRAWPSNHGAPLPTAHLQHGAHQVTSALGWRSGASGSIETEPRRIQPFRRLLGCSGPPARAWRSLSHGRHEGRAIAAPEPSTKPWEQALKAWELRALPPANLVATSSCRIPWAKTRDRLLSSHPTVSLVCYPNWLVSVTNPLPLQHNSK